MMKQRVRIVNDPRVSLAIGLSLLFSLSCCGAGGDNDALPARAEVLVSITPGKPGAPTETVKASWNGTKAALDLKRGAADAAAEEETVNLPEDEFRKLWRLVVKENLRTFEPAKRSGQVFDFGERRLEIVSAQTANDQVARHAVNWDTPLTNESALQPLLQELGRIANKHAQKVKLSYFPGSS